MVIYGSSIDEIYNRIKDLPVSNFLEEVKRELEEEKELDDMLIQIRGLLEDKEKEGNDSENEKDDENVTSIIIHSKDPIEPSEKIDIPLEEFLDELEQETLNYILNHVEEILNDDFNLEMNEDE